MVSFERDSGELTNEISQKLVSSRDQRRCAQNFSINVPICVGTIISVALVFTHLLDKPLGACLELVLH